MSIPSAQLSAWSNRGAITTSSEAYRSVQVALKKEGSPLANLDVEVFLQGSYANATNIRADSDIDVVVFYDDTFVPDKTKLSPAEIQRYDSTHSEATYKWAQLRDDTIRALQQHFTVGAVTPGTKAIAVATRAGGMTADVVPAIGYRRYATYPDAANATGWFGIQFWDSSGNPIVNFPKQHVKRGEDKNQAARTRGLYKPTIRLFKNYRNALVQKQQLADEIAPSYFLECTLSNVPDEHFIGEFNETVPGILEYLWGTFPDSFMSQNGIVPLFGDTTTQWSTQKLAVLLQAMRSGWNDW
jgi:hypothetical protein